LQFTSLYPGHPVVCAQAQALLTKNLLYQNLDSCLHQLASCTPAVYGFLPRSPVDAGAGGDGAGEVVTAAQRDAAVTHLRFLNIFCNFRHDTFAHAVQLLDLVLGRVKVTNDSRCSVSIFTSFDSRVGY